MCCVCVFDFFGYFSNVIAEQRKQRRIIMIYWGGGGGVGKSESIESKIIQEIEG